jgi:hypothetical protein
VVLLVISAGMLAADDEPPPRRRRRAALIGGAVMPVALAPPFFCGAGLPSVPWQALLERLARARRERVHRLPPLAQLICAVPLAAGAGRSRCRWASVVAAAVALRALARRLGAGRRLADLAGRPAAAALALVPDCRPPVDCSPRCWCRGARSVDQCPDGAC